MSRIISLRRLSRIRRAYQGGRSAPVLDYLSVPTFSACPGSILSSGVFGQRLSRVGDIGDLVRSAPVPLHVRGFTSPTSSPVPFQRASAPVPLQRHLFVQRLSRIGAASAILFV